MLQKQMMSVIYKKDKAFPNFIAPNNIRYLLFWFQYLYDEIIWYNVEKIYK